MASGIAGSVVPISYGYNWRTGYKLQGRTLQNTGNVNLDYTRVGMYLLGEGEEDGLEELWDAGLGRLLLQNESDNTNIFHWHSGCDAIAGSGSYAGSIGTDQGVDSFWSMLPPGLQPLHYHRWSYYAFAIKQLINSPPNTNQNDPSVWADVTPVGLWRCLRCCIFDEYGTMTGYAFTRNPVWHYVDLLCRRKLFPEYKIDYNAGADDLTTAVRNRFIWSALAESAADCDLVLSNGLPRFTGDYSFAQKTSLQACTSQIFASCRGRNLERGGQFGMIVDKPRASVFTFSGANADSFVVSDADLHTAPNLLVGKFRDLEIPAFGNIVSIGHEDNQDPAVTMDRPHPVTTDDYVVIGGTGTPYDSNWRVRASTGDYTFTVVNKGNNYPALFGPGGTAGLRFSRFKDRAPEFRHVAHQYARGAVGAGIPRIRNKARVETDFGNTTWSQAARLSSYQRATTLGPDTVPYVAPPRASLRAPLFAKDAAGSGAVAIQLEPGDVVTVTPDLDATYAGLWELTTEDMAFVGSTSAQGMQRTATGGGLDLQMRPYSDDNYPDEAPAGQPGWPTVPGLPGSVINATIIPLADGEAAFYVGSGADGDSYPIMDGFRLQNSLAWASPQGYIEHDGQMHIIQDCDAYTDRILRMTYTDTGAKFWRGDVNYAVLAWRTRNSASFTYSGSMQYVELTLAGGEKIIFGKGVFSDGQSTGLPSGYFGELTKAIAFPKTAAPESANVAHGVAAWMLADGRVMNRYQDGSGNVWGGSGAALIMSFKNNMGTWKMRPDGWAYCPLAGGKTLAIGGFSIFDNSLSGSEPTFYGEPGYGPPMGARIDTGGKIPAFPQMPATTLQAMTGPDGFQIVDHPAHGIRNCSVSSDGTATCNFEDGEGNIWLGSSGVLGLLCDVATADPGGLAAPAGSTVWTQSYSGGGGGGGTGTGGPGGGGRDPDPGRPSPVLDSTL